MKHVEFWYTNRLEKNTGKQLANPNNWRFQLNITYNTLFLLFSFLIKVLLHLISTLAFLMAGVLFKAHLINWFTKGWPQLKISPSPLLEKGPYRWKRWYFVPNSNYKVCFFFEISTPSPPILPENQTSPIFTIEMAPN